MQMISSERTKLFVDGVGAAITADVTRRRNDGMVVTQALPFLRLDTPVTGDDGQRARISRVAIAMDGDVPRLLLELSNEIDLSQDLEEPLRLATAEEDTPEDTLETFTPGVSMRPARTDGTVPYEFQPRESTGEIVVSDPQLSAIPELSAPEPHVPEPHVPVAVSWPVRMLRRLAAFFMGFYRPAPMLPPG